MLSVVVHAAPSFDDYTFHFANALSRYARVGYVIDSGQRNRFGNALSGDVEPITFHRPRRRQLWGAGEMYGVSRAVGRFNPDVFHLQNYGPWESLLLRMIGKVPVVNTVHDPIQHIDYRSFLNEALARDAIYRADGWVIHSEGLRQVLLNRYRVDPDRTLVHPLGIHDYYCRFASADAQREKYILFFGEPRINKGFDLLVNAFSTILDRLDDWNIVLAGKGSIGREWSASIHQLGERCIYLNRHIPDAEVAGLFSRAGIVALPYRHGSQSAVLGIAAAFGCAVLATPVGNMAEIMEDRKHALFVEPDDEQALAEGLLRLTGDEGLRVRLGENLEGLGRTAWSWDLIARRSVEFYEKLLHT
jgi:glycosyltransferase involved in cell wall biosynthesis